MSTRRSAFLSVICLGLIQACSGNFTFTYGAATECDDFHVSWTGGTPPFTLTFVPTFQAKITETIPDSAFDGTHGSYTTKTTLKATNKTVVVMSDHGGFGSGGVSPLITVGKSLQQHPSCDTTQNTKNNFIFTTDQSLIQCNPYWFKGYGNASQPVTITGVVVGGSTFVLHPPTGPTEFSWVANIAAGTDVLFFMTDAKGQQGGTSDVTRVMQSDNASCLDNSSPTSAVSPPSSTATITGPQSGNLSGSSSTSSLTSGPMLAAIVVPVVAVVALFIAAFFWYRRVRRNSGVRVLGRPPRPEIDLTMGDADEPQHMRELSSHSAVPLLHGRSPSADGAGAFDGYTPRLPPAATASHFTECLSPDSAHSDSTQGYQYGAMSAYGSSHGGSSQYSAASGPPLSYASSSGSGRRAGTSSGARRKAAEAGILTPPGDHPPAQFILHTDIADSIPPPPVAEVVELPPQYSERPALPIASGSGALSHTASSSSSQP